MNLKDTIVQYVFYFVLILSVIASFIIAYFMLSVAWTLFAIVFRWLVAR